MNTDRLYPYLIVLLSLAACQSKTTKDTTLQEYPVTRISLTDTVLYKEYVSDVHAQRYVEIRARVQGYLDYIYVDEGQTVAAGQLLFKINDEEYRAEAERAKANLNSAVADAQATLLESERIKILVDKNVVSQTEYRLAKAKVEVANARVEEAKSALTQANIKLSHTSIRAPFAGVVDRLPFKIGSLIDEGHLLTHIFDSKSIYAYFRVSEKEYLDYMKSHPDERSPDQVSFILADGTVHANAGIIETLEGEFDTSTGTIAFRAKFPNHNNLIKHGSSGKVRLANVIENVLMVPQKATFEIQDKTFVFTVDKNNEVRMTSFQPATRLAHSYIVKSGLKPGDVIVYEGIQSIKDGMRIKATSVRSDSTLARTHHGKIKTTS